MPSSFSSRHRLYQYFAPKHLPPKDGRLFPSAVGAALLLPVGPAFRARPLFLPRRNRHLLAPPSSPPSSSSNPRRPPPSAIIRWPPRSPAPACLPTLLPPPP